MGSKRPETTTEEIRRMRLEQNLNKALMGLDQALVYLKRIHVPEIIEDREALQSIHNRLDAVWEKLL